MGTSLPKISRSDCIAMKVSRVLKKIQRPKRSKDRALALSQRKRLRIPGRAV